MEKKEAVAQFLGALLIKTGITRDDLAGALGVTTSMLPKYLHAQKLPSVDVLLRLSELTGVSINEILTGGKSGGKETGGKVVNIQGDRNTVAQAGDNSNISQNNLIALYPSIKYKTEYSYKPGDMTPEQAQKVQEMVKKIVELEQTTRQRPKSYAAIYGALKKRFRVTFYREIPEDKYGEVELYLHKWMGRLQRSLQRKDPDDWRKKKYTAIHASKKQLNWTAQDLRDWLFGGYGVESLKDLTDEDLNTVYNAIQYRKRR